ncbi:hypothetical protein ACOME3_009397 [Neoechinorhynchus agilis]
MFAPAQVPVMVLSRNTHREQGRKVQLNNIRAACAISEVVKTCLGPMAMVKMLIDPMSGIVLTNDGNAILRDITVAHPAAKMMIEISRTQDEEVGDGTTSVVVIASELLNALSPFLEQNNHPVVLIKALKQALEDVVGFMMAKDGGVCNPIDVNDTDQMIRIIKSCLQTKMVSNYGDLICQIALRAVRSVEIPPTDGGRHEIDIKRYARIERIPGGSLSDSYVVNGIALNKDLLHPKMPRRIENPKVVLLDCPLEYKKGESQTMMELTKETDFTRALELEEEEIRGMCADLMKVGANIVVTEKGVSDLAIHLLMKAKISVIRRVRKTDNDRLARITGATVCSDPSEIRDGDVGLKCGVFEMRELNNGEMYAFFEQCQNPKACTILLRGPSKDFIDEVARNLEDAMCVARNIFLDPFVAPGGGACEMELSKRMQAKATDSTSDVFSGVGKFVYLACSNALEIIPKLLIENSGNTRVIQTLMALRVAHSPAKEDNGPSGNYAQLRGINIGIDGFKGTIVDSMAANVVEPRIVKLQAYKSAFETAMMIVRIDDIVSGSRKGTELDAKRGEEQRENITKTEKDNN